MEICDPRNNITMCPLCDHACSYWKLVTACGTARASHLFDNPATVFFSIFMALWGEGPHSHRVTHKGPRLSPVDERKGLRIQTAQPITAGADPVNRSEH
ncbi:hypothetical protein F2P81_005016 [Scophthalmus maximus]|uniref:Anoctamin n=1 Tax=Scophthalmus maximus TaxID=52904 RepID=A0A6A4TFS5_SCOMX|nr:hypothetical protein F2P81_005016 [Scophthalmus maximus]